MKYVHLIQVKVTDYDDLVEEAIWYFKCNFTQRREHSYCKSVVAALDYVRKLALSII